jgi:hypothetical protein
MWPLRNACGAEREWGAPAPSVGAARGAAGAVGAEGARGRSLRGLLGREGLGRLAAGRRYDARALATIGAIARSASPRWLMASLAADDSSPLLTF